MIETKFKNTEVGLIPQDWEVKSLGELGDVQMCKRIFNYQTSETGDIPFFKIGTLGGAPDAYISRSLYEDFRSKYKFPQKGELLISAAGTIGRIFVYDGQDCYYQDSNIVWLRHNEEVVSNKFLAFAFKIIEWKSQDGGTISRLYNANFRATSFCYPTDKQEQQRIATALSDVDELIVTTDQLLQKKRDIKQGTMQQLLTGKRRLPGFEGEWEFCSVSDKIFVGKGQSLQSKDFVQGNIPVIAGGQSYAGYHNRANTNNASITISASGAYAGFVWFHNYPIFATDCAVIAEKEDVSLVFLYYLLKSKQDDIYKLQTGGAQPHIYPRHISAIKIHIPSDLAEQQAIAQVLTDMDAEIEDLERNFTKYKALREAMMQQLLTGKIRLI